MIRIIHTADNHIGRNFHGRDYKPTTREALINERFLALHRVVQAGNVRKAHFLVIAGDLFDSPRVSRRDIQRVINILKAFEGEAVLILPGNHDFFERSADSLWMIFQQLCDDDRICLLNDYQPVQYTCGEQIVNFYPAPCRSKHSTTNEIEWIIEREIDQAAINLGIAHGNVEGQGFNGERHFNMSVPELVSAQLDTWLLGHIHVPYPFTAQQTRPAFFFPGTHTPEDFNCRHDGLCWFLEIDSDKEVHMEQVKTGALRFHRLSYRVDSAEDLAELIRVIEQFPVDASLVCLELDGKLTAEELDLLHQTLESFQRRLLHFEWQEDVTQRIDQEYIDQHYSADTLPHRLLAGLATDTEHSLALQLAHQLIQQVNG